MSQTVLAGLVLFCLACTGGSDAFQPGSARDEGAGPLIEQRIEANERMAIASLLAMASNQASYWSTTGSSYGSLECLEKPSECIEGYAGPRLSDPYRVEERAYQRTLRLSADAKSFTYVLAPISRGETGRRAFCVDATGRTCASCQELILEQLGGHWYCPRLCPDLRSNSGAPTDPEAEAHLTAAFAALEKDDADTAIPHLEKFLEVAAPDDRSRSMAEEMLSHLKEDQRE